MNMLGAAKMTAQTFGCRYGECPKPVLCSEECADARNRKMSETGQTELLLCPFCGTAPIIDEHPAMTDDDGAFVVIRCTCCGISKEWNYKSNAVKWWNGRPELTRLQQANAALVEALKIVKLYIKDEGIAHAVVPPKGEIPHGKMPTLLNVVESALAQQ